MSAEAYQRQINVIDQDIARLNARIADLQKQIAHKEADRTRIQKGLTLLPQSGDRIL